MYIACILGYGTKYFSICVKCRRFYGKHPLSIKISKDVLKPPGAECRGVFKQSRGVVAR
jgi:hypothetical protein